MVGSISEANTETEATGSEPSRPALLLLAAHPDDETIGAAILLSRTKNVRVIHVTDGSPLATTEALAAGFPTREAYTLARKTEVIRALEKAGIGKRSVWSLGFTDQRTVFALRELTQSILALLCRERPEILLTHAYEGGHPDHDSVAFASHIAYRLYCTEMTRPRLPTHLFEFACYNGRGGKFHTNEFLPQPNSIEYRVRFTPTEQMLKQEMFSAFASQQKTLEVFCPPEIERFRRAPHYHFRRPPHGGKLLYENFDWGVDGKGWRELALKARQDLYREEGRRESNES